MKLDPTLESALNEVVSEAGQPEVVARRLQVWLETMNEEIQTPDATRYLQLLCNKLEMEDESAH